ncbi:MFS general substrate transporter [Phanerochaete sordida]|uniref:MFS general substrate transporter n=1 Tax=Phanerochaete sordida TaxID=48140 RepID=A0A9P3LGN0_9APHY|nr:MFS general substrate transporter [Phanerochaete sordida]
MESIELRTYTEVHDPYDSDKATLADVLGTSKGDHEQGQLDELPSNGLYTAGALPEEQAISMDALVNETRLAPVDRGFSAWAMLVASCVVELFVWGFPNSSGVLLAAYLKDPLYSSQKHATSILPLVGTLCTGIMYCSGLVVYPSMHYYPRLRRIYTWSGTVICFVSLLAASFTRNVTMLIALQGVTFAIGGSLVYAPVISYMSEWFVQRRGMANGILVAGDNLGGVLFPIIMPALISRFGIMVTTRIYAIALLVCLLPALPFMKARLPETRVHGPAPRSHPRPWMRDRAFWFFITINTLQGFAHFVPLTWLPTFATALGLTTGQASLALTLVNAASIFAGFGMGWLSDRYNVWALAVSSLLLTSLATFVLWGVLSYSLAGILAYGVAYGSTAGCWSSMWNGFVRPVAKDDPSLATTMFSILLLTRGVGNILSTPISTTLQHTKLAIAHGNGSTKTGFAVDDGRYNAVIIYAGTCFAGAAVVAALGWSLDRKRNVH